MTEQEVKVKCQYCGKFISNDDSIEHEAGGYCHSLREQGWDSVRLTEHRASMTVSEVPTTKAGEPWIKVAALDRKLKKMGVPISRMVRAMGGDRSIDPPLHPKFKPVYVGRARYLDPWCASAEGIEFLKGLANSSPPTENTTPKATKTTKKVSVKTTA